MANYDQAMTEVKIVFIFQSPQGGSARQTNPWQSVPMGQTLLDHVRKATVKYIDLF